MSKAGGFYGKYRGRVTNNVDPDKIGRIKAKVPDVFGKEETGWALPCVPYGGKGVGFFFIPPKDTHVWIEFEHGDPTFPIWTGCFWHPEDQTSKPPGDGAPDTKVIKTDVVTMTINDLQGKGGITIETTNGMKIVMDVKGIEFNNNGSMTIKLTQASVSINDGALEVV